VTNLALAKVSGINALQGFVDLRNQLRNLLGGRMDQRTVSPG